MNLPAVPLSHAHWLLPDARLLACSLKLRTLAAALPTFQDATLLQPGHVAAVLLVIVSGSVNFQGDPSKKTRDGGMWRDSALGELCSDAVLSAGDVIALGRPGDEGMLAQFHAMSSTSQVRTGPASLPIHPRRQ